MTEGVASVVDAAGLIQIVNRQTEVLFGYPRAELLGLEAGNALLKALEEPGRHLHWILTTTRPEALLPTILSRCAMAPIPSPSRGQRRAVWRERGFSAEEAEDLGERRGGRARARGARGVCRGLRRAAAHGQAGASR